MKRGKSKEGLREAWNCLGTVPSFLIVAFLFDIGIFSLLGYLFFENFLFTLVLVTAATPIFMIKQKKQYIKKQKDILSEQFKDAVFSLAVALRAGYSVENGIAEVYREVVALHGKESLIARELNEMLKRLRLQVAIEDLFEEFGKRSGVEDIRNFASVFKIAKRSGGDLVAIIGQTAKTIGDKCDIQREISTMIAAKRLEQRIMLCMPMAILLYLKLLNPGFLDVMYESVLGQMIMLGCLVVYAVAFFAGEKIVEIEV